MPNLSLETLSNDFNISRVERLYGKDISTGKDLYIIEGTLNIASAGAGVNRIAQLTIPNLDLIRMMTFTNINANPVDGCVVFYGWNSYVNLAGAERFTITFRNLGLATSVVTTHNFRIIYTKKP